MSGFSLGVLISSILLGVFPRLLKTRVEDVDAVGKDVRANLNAAGERGTLAHDLGRLRGVLRWLLAIGVVYLAYLAFVLLLLVGIDTIGGFIHAQLAARGVAITLSTGGMGAGFLEALYDAVASVEIGPLDRLIAAILLAIGAVDFYLQGLRPWLRGRQLAAKARRFLARRV